MSTNQSSHGIERHFKPFQHLLQKARLLTHYKKWHELENQRMSLKQNIMDGDKQVKKLNQSRQKILQTLKTLSDKHSAVKQKYLSDIKHLEKLVMLTKEKLLRDKQRYHALNQKCFEFDTSH